MLLIARDNTLMSLLIAYIDLGRFLGCKREIGTSKLQIGIQ